VGGTIYAAAPPFPHFYECLMSLAHSQRCCG
jgi:hypothetical protein